MPEQNRPSLMPVVLAVLWTVVLAVSLTTQVVRERASAVENAEVMVQGRLESSREILEQLMQSPGLFRPADPESGEPEDWIRLSGKEVLFTMQRSALIESSFEVYRPTDRNFVSDRDMATPLAAVLAGDDYGSVVRSEEEGDVILGLMALRATEGCLSCHPQAQEGELLGVLTTTMPLEPHREIAARHTRLMVGWHGILWMVGVGMLTFWGRRRIRLSKQRTVALVELADSHQRYQLLVETALAIPWELDLERGVFTYVGPQAEAISGYPAATWTDFDAWAAMIHPEDRQRGIDACEAATGRLEDHSFEYRIVKPDGELIWVRDVVKVVIQDGRAVALRGIIVDVSDQRRVEEERQLLEVRMQRSQRIESLGVLAGGIAHDFNNLLTPIVGFSEMALLEIPEESPARAKLRQVVAAAEQAGNLVRQILTFSRGEQKDRRALVVAPLVSETVTFLRASLPANVEVALGFEVGSFFVNADPTEIHQIILNLCTNAAHAIGGNPGTIEIRLDEIEDPRSRGREAESSIVRSVRLQVRDDGEGMPPEVQEHIFEPFFTTKEVGRGSGLGLSVVHGIVESLGGRILVESQVGQGTSISVMLPLVAQDPSENTEALVAAVPATGTETILLVDDEPVILMMCRQYLEGLGYKVVSSSDGQEALNLFRASPERFDILVTDQGMPGLTGLELCREVRAIREDFICVLATGYGAGVQDEATGTLELDGILEKPFSGSELANRIREIFKTKGGEA